MAFVVFDLAFIMQQLISSIRWAMCTGIWCWQITYNTSPWDTFVEIGPRTFVPLENTRIQTYPTTSSKYTRIFFSIQKMSKVPKFNPSKLELQSSEVSPCLKAGFPRGPWTPWSHLVTNGNRLGSHGNHRQSLGKAPRSESHVFA